MIMKKEDPFLLSLDRIPASGLAVEARLETGWAASVLVDAYKASGKSAALSYSVTRDGARLKIKGGIDLEVLFDCSRCAEAAAMRRQFPVDVLYLPEKQRRIMLGDAPEDHDRFTELYGYESERFSVEEPFIEAVVLGLEPYPICRPECKGLCQQCGTDLNLKSCSCRSEPDHRWAALAGLKASLAVAEERKERGDQNGSHQEEEIQDEDPQPPGGQ